MSSDLMTSSDALEARPGTIGELIEVPAVQTVVHLADLARADARVLIADSFVLTDEVKRHLKRLLAAVTAPGPGMGSFLRGHYGAGKSHFLAFLQLLLTGQVELAALMRAEPELVPLLEALAGRRFRVATVSLVEHGGRERLEAIVAGALERCVGSPSLAYHDLDVMRAHIDTFRYHLRQHQTDVLELFLYENGIGEAELFSVESLPLLERLAAEVRYPFRPDPGRMARFEHLFHQLTEEGCSGVVLLIDELSEFLHAKQGPELAEDVRFLQFLGETTSIHPFYVLAALQEYLEAAEYGLPGELVRKIKDRYPNNLELTTTHIEELIHRRLIRHRPGAEARIREVYRQLRTWLQGFPIPEDRFVRNYPIHPATVLLLERLKPLLSRSRGIVDFIHHRLRGSLERGIEGLLDAPQDTLLTPETIFDHFQWRFRENLEIAAYDTVVHEYFLRAVETLFTERSTQLLALRLVKLLILLAISPDPRPYSVRTLTHALLVRVSRVDPDANFVRVQEVLEILLRDGAYLERTPARPDGRLDFNDVYQLSLKADVNLVLSRRVSAALASLREAPDLRIFEALAPELQLESLPFQQLLPRRSQALSIQWQRTQRDGRVSVLPFTQLDVVQLSDLLEALRTTDLEWCLFIGVPYELEAQRQHLENVLFPALRRAEPLIARMILFWVPRPMQLESPEGTFLRETLARRAVLARLREEAATSQSRGLMEHLERAMEQDRPRVESLFHLAYYQGRIQSVAGEEENISNLGRPLFHQTLLAVLTPVLTARYPDHAGSAPLGRLPALDDLEAVVEQLFKTGSYALKGGDGDALGSRMISLLRPLGLIKRSGSSLVLSPDSTRPGPIRLLLGQLEPSPRPLSEVSLALRKGSLGLSLPMLQLLVLGLAYAGLVVCYSRDRRRDASQLTALSFDQLDAISRNEALVLDLSPLAQLPALPENAIPRGELNFARQEQLWDQLREARDRLAETLRRAREGVRRAKEYQALAQVDFAALESDLAALSPLTLIGGPGLTAREGIEKTLQVLQEIPHARPLFARLEAAGTFFQVSLERVLLLSRYTQHLGQLPQTLELVAARQALEEVQVRLQSPDLPFNPLSIELLEAAFKRLLDAYVPVYRDAHAQARGPERFAPYEAMRHHAAYRLLVRLSRLTSLVVDDHRSQLDRQLDAILRQRCARFSLEELRTMPHCVCGYRLGEQVTLPEVRGLELALLEGVRASLDALQAESVRQALQSSQEKLLTLGETAPAERIEAFLAVAAQGGLTLPEPDSEGAISCVGLDGLLNDGLIRELERAMQGVAKIEPRSLESLVAALAGRCLTRADAEAVFRAWLGGPSSAGGGSRLLGDSIYYRFVQENSGPQDDDPPEGQKPPGSGS